MAKKLNEYMAPEAEISTMFAGASVIAASDGDPLKLPGTTFDDFIIP